MRIILSILYVITFGLAIIFLADDHRLVSMMFFCASCACFIKFKQVQKEEERKPIDYENLTFDHREGWGNLEPFGIFESAARTADYKCWQTWWGVLPLTLKKRYYRGYEEREHRKLHMSLILVLFIFFYAAVCIFHYCTACIFLGNSLDADIAFLSCTDDHSVYWAGSRSVIYL